MEIQRYLNGKPVAEKELTVLNLMTPELQHVMVDARRRAMGERPPSSLSFKEKEEAHG